MARVEVIKCDRCGQEMDSYGWGISVTIGHEFEEREECCAECKAVAWEFWRWLTDGTLQSPGFIRVVSGKEKPPIYIHSMNGEVDAPPIVGTAEPRALVTGAIVLVPEFELNAEGKAEKPIMVPGQPCSECGSVIGQEPCETDICHLHTGGGLTTECRKCKGSV